MVDHMRTPIVHPLIDGVHVVLYDPTNRTGEAPSGNKVPTVPLLAQNTLFAPVKGPRTGYHVFNDSAIRPSLGYTFHQTTTFVACTRPLLTTVTLFLLLQR